MMKCRFRLTVWSLSVCAIAVSLHVIRVSRRGAVRLFPEFLERHRAEGLQRRHADHAEQRIAAGRRRQGPGAVRQGTDSFEPKANQDASRRAGCRSSCFRRKTAQCATISRSGRRPCRRSRIGKRLSIGPPKARTISTGLRSRSPTPAPSRPRRNSSVEQTGKSRSAKHDQAWSLAPGRVGRGLRADSLRGRLRGERIGARKIPKVWLERTVEYWQGVMAGAAKIEVPCRKATEALMAAHVCQLIASDHGVDPRRRRFL